MPSCKTLLALLMGPVLPPLAGDWPGVHLSRSTKTADTTGVLRSKVPADGDKDAVKFALFLERGERQGDADPMRRGPDDSGSVLFVPGACLRDD